MNALIKSNSLIKEILKDRYRSLVLIIGLMILTGIVQATSVLGLMPIVDFVINQDQQEHNEITQVIANTLYQYNIPVNILSLGILLSNHNTKPAVVPPANNVKLLVKNSISLFLPEFYNTTFRLDIYKYHFNNFFFIFLFK